MRAIRHIFPIFGLFLCLGLELFGQQPVAKDTEAADADSPQGLKLGAPSEAEKLLDKAITELEQLGQFSTDLRQEVKMFGHRFTGIGRYMVGAGFQMRFEMKLQLTSQTTGSLLEICDGQTHWRSLKILDTHELERLNLERAREIFEKPEFDKSIRDRLIQQLGFSGLLPLMRGLRDTLKFDRHEEGKIGEKPVYVLHGGWKEEAFKGMTIHRRPVALANLPPFVPSKGTLWIDQNTGWPHRLELRSERTEENETVIRLEFLNPQVGVELPEANFAFEPPPDVEQSDRTQQICQQLGQLLRRAQQTKRSGPVKKGSD